MAFQFKFPLDLLVLSFRVVEVSSLLLFLPSCTSNIFMQRYVCTLYALPCWSTRVHYCCEMVFARCFPVPSLCLGLGTYQVIHPNRPWLSLCARVCCNILMSLPGSFLHFGLVTFDFSLVRYMQCDLSVLSLILQPNFPNV